MLTFESQQRFSYPSARVLKRYCDADFMLEKHKALGHQEVAVVERAVQGSVLRMRVSFVHVTKGKLPKIAQRLMKARTQVVQALEWDLEKDYGRITVDLKGAPVRVEGKMHLTDDPQGCTASVVWKLHCSVPLIGSKLEAFLQETMTSMMKQDQAVTASLLSTASPRTACAA